VINTPFGNIKREQLENLQQLPEIQGNPKFRLETRLLSSWTQSEKTLAPGGEFGLVMSGFRGDLS